jgi:hypothetical protein
MITTVINAMIAPTIRNIQLSIWRHTAIPHTVAKRAAVRCSRSHSAAARHLLWRAQLVQTALLGCSVAYLCTREQRREALARTLSICNSTPSMPPLLQSASRQSVPPAFAGNVRSLSGWAVLTGLAVLPPLVLMWLWNDPRQTMPETIQEALR